MEINLKQEKMQLLDEAFTLFQKMLKEKKFTDPEINFLTRVVCFMVQLHENKAFKKSIYQQYARTRKKH